MESSINLKEKGLFQNRNYMLLLVGQIVSNLGNAVHSVAVAWFIMNMVGEASSGTYMAIFSACALIPYIIFGPISGVYVDRISRKKIIVGTDIARGSLILILAACVYYNFYPLIALFVVTFCSAFFGSFFNPAIDASIPNVVGEKNLTQANSLNGISRQLTWIFGGAISGFLYYKIGIVGIFIVNGLSFILSGLSEMFIQLSNVKKEKKDNDGFWQDFKLGIKFVRGQKAILVLMGFALVLNFLFSPIFQIIFPKTLKFTLGLGAEQYGIFQSIFPVGAMIGMVLIGVLTKRYKSYSMLRVATVAQAFILMGFGVPIIPQVLGKLGISTTFALYCILSLFMAIFNAIINVPVFTAFQKAVPDEYRGRFFGLLNTLSQGIVPLGLAVFGVISDRVAPYIIFLTVGAISVALSLWMIVIPELRELVKDDNGQINKAA